MCLLQTSQKCKKDRLSLKLESLLRVFILLYQQKVSLDIELCRILRVLYTYENFAALSVYIFTQFFALGTQYFQCSMDEMYCILFTCIALSDPKILFLSRPSLTAGVGSAVSYFYVVYLFNKHYRVIFRNAGPSPWYAFDTKEINRYFGNYLIPFDSTSNNFLRYDMTIYMPKLIVDCPRFAVPLIFL